jgi:hypothetical protein
MFKKILSLVCAFATVASFATMNIAHADDALVTTALEVSLAGTVEEVLVDYFGDDEFDAWIDRFSEPVYEVKMTLDGFAEKKYDSVNKVRTGLVTDGGMVIVKFDSTKFDCYLTSNYAGIVEGTDNYAYLTWMNGDGKITKNGPYGSFYFIPKDGQEVTDYTVFEIPTEAVGAADAITKFNVEYYDGTSTKATISNDYISVADGKISTSSCYLGTAAPTTKTLGYEADLAYDGVSTGFQFVAERTDADVTVASDVVTLPSVENLGNVKLGLNIENIPADKAFDDIKAVLNVFARWVK